MKKTTIFLLTLLLMSSVGFSQKIILIKQDTMMCFSLDQSRFLLNQTAMVKQLDTLLRIKRRENMNYQVIIRNDSLNNHDLREQVDNYVEIVSLKETQVEGVKGVVKDLKKEVRRQKVQKWIGVGLAAGTAYLGFKAGQAFSR